MSAEANAEVEAAPAEAPAAWSEITATPLSEAQRAIVQKANEALGAQIGTLNEKRQWAQTEKLVEARWTQILQEGVGRFFWVLPAYLEALQKQGKADEAATVMRQLSAFYLVRAGSSEAVWLTGWTAETLEKAGDNENALRWAKLSWMLCAHDESQIRQSMQRLARLWNNVGLDRKTGLALLDFQLKRATQNRPATRASSVLTA